MARIRTIKPDFWKSEKVARCGRPARLLFIGMWNFAEDSGCMRASPQYVRAEVFPYDDDVTVEDVARWMDELEAAGLIARYERPSGRFLMVRGFREHQRIDKPSKPQLPLPTQDELEKQPSTSPPGVLRESSASPPRALPESSASPPSGNGVEGNGVEGELAADAATGQVPQPEKLTLPGENFEMRLGGSAEPPSKKDKVQKERAISKQQRLYAALEEWRREHCEEEGIPFVPERWPLELQNVKLKRLEELPESVIDRAWQAYLAAEKGSTLTPAWSIGYWLTSLSRWEQEARNALAQMSAAGGAP